MWVPSARGSSPILKPLRVLQVLTISLCPPVGIRASRPSTNADTLPSGTIMSHSPLCLIQESPVSCQHLWHCDKLTRQLARRVTLWQTNMLVGKEGDSQTLLSSWNLPFQIQSSSIEARWITCFTRDVTGRQKRGSQSTPRMTLNKNPPGNTYSLHTIHQILSAISSLFSLQAPPQPTPPISLPDWQVHPQLFSAVIPLLKQRNLTPASPSLVSPASPTPSWTTTKDPHFLEGSWIR